MQHSTAFLNAFLIDGKELDPQPGATVVVAEGRIQEVHLEGEKGKIPKGRVIDLAGKTMMPGLIDAHVHAGTLELSMEKTIAIPPAVYVLRTTKNLETALDLGFTTLRDGGGLDWSFRAAVDQGLIRGPRLFLSVNPLTQTGGHADKRGASREEPMPRNSIGVYPEVCDGVDEVRKGAREALRRGADQVKVMADGGVASPSDTPGQWQYTVDELRAAVETAEAADTYVMAHVYTPKAGRNCLEAGVRSIEHGNLLDEETIKLMVEKGAYLVPTLTTYDVLAKEGVKAGMDPYVIEKLHYVHEGARRALDLAHRAGVKICSGSDIIGPYQHLKGREFALKAEVMTPMETIISATRTNAELLNISDRLGTVEPGKLADLIVMDGNPLDDPTLFEQGLETVVLVMKEGVIMKDLLITR